MDNVINVKADENIVLELGRQNDNKATCIQFNINANWLSDLPPGGQFQLLAKRPGEEQFFPVPITVDGNYAEWLITQADVAYEGYGSCQLTYIISQQEKRSKQWTTSVLPSMVSEGPAPEAYQDWVDDMIRIGAETKQNAIDAEIAKNSAEIAQGAAEESAEQARIQADYAAGIMGLAVFNIDIEDGNLYVTYPTPYYGAVFSINEAGYLEVTTNE